MNRYYAWYHDPGHLEIIQRQFDSQLRKWYEAFKKPIIQAEYGADAVAGLHVVSLMISNDYEARDVIFLPFVTVKFNDDYKADHISRKGHFIL